MEFEAIITEEARTIQLRHQWQTVRGKVLDTARARDGNRPELQHLLDYVDHCDKGWTVLSLSIRDYSFLWNVEF